MRTAILDDEPLAIELLEDYVKKTKGLQLVYADTDAFRLLEKVQAGEIDLIFLDIQMPELSGIQFLKIASNQCLFILTTAYTEYALDGYAYNVIDYLLKPISYERFYQSVKKLPQFKSKYYKQETNQANVKDYLFVKSEYKNLKIQFRDIIFIKSASDYVEYYLYNQTKILSLDTLKSLIHRLNHHKFIQIHKSYIINIDHIDFIERNRVILSNRERLPIGDSYRNDFFAIIHN